MNSVKPSDLDSPPLSPSFLCPYLGKRYDAETYSAVRDLPNYCHKAAPNAPVSIEHQIVVCTTEGYKDCPVFLAIQPPVLLNGSIWIRFLEVRKAAGRGSTCGL
jgi:hypothetical protein